MINDLSRQIDKYHGHILTNVALALVRRGWKLGKGIRDAPPEVLLERILNEALKRPSGEGGQAPAPLPTRLLEACGGPEQAGPEPRELLRSWIAAPAGLGAILDSLTLWLDYDQCRNMDHLELHAFFRGRQCGLRENAYYAMLTRDLCVYRTDCEMIGRRADFQELSPLHKLSMLGTFGIVDFAAEDIRNQFHTVLLKRHKTGRVAEFFLKFHEKAVRDPHFARVVVVFGSFSLFISIQDFLAGLKETAVTPENVQALQCGPIHELVGFLRQNFLRGISKASPSSHFRHDQPRHPALIRTMGMTFWQRKLRERMSWEEQNSIAVSRPAKPAERARDASPGQDYHSRMILKSIPPNAVGSVEFPKQCTLDSTGIGCRLAGWKDSRIILFVSPEDYAAIQVEIDDPLHFRFSLEARSGTRAFYTLPCILDHASRISTEITAILARPAGPMTKTSRRHARCVASRLPILGALLWTGISERPRSKSDFPDPATALRPGIVASEPVRLTDLSAGGAGLQVSHAASAARLVRCREEPGLLLLQLDSGMEKAVQLGLIFRIVYLSKSGKLLQAGLGFLAEADCTRFDVLDWRGITGQGCHELGRLLFAAQQQERGCG
ncbi:hypothetical protein [Desulfonatronum thioautotrophicum]|uniref:hypothetical protein n=1 Tax=Desulfonatronum thioautotrophicum TaxID=617001 RepID=UPI0012947BF9|nr:hypothetical protein [Desulfonatronum thioautotrophicum]